MQQSFVGALTGRTFSYDGGKHLRKPGSLGTMFGHHQGLDVEHGAPVYVRAIADLSGSHVDEIVGARRAIAIAQRPTIQECAAICQLIDFSDETVDTYGFGDPYPHVRSAWEWGDHNLHDEIKSGQYDAGALATSVEQSIGDALKCFHAEGLVHSDVAPNNIVRVAGEWNLIDLDNVVREGETVTGTAQSPFALEGVDVGDSARREMDRHGLAEVLAMIRRQR